MKLRFFLCFFSVFSILAVFAQDIDIWGKWNLGDETIVDYHATIDGKVYVAVWDHNVLSFHNNYYGNGPRISYNGGSYEIERIEYINSGLVYLYVSTGYYELIRAKIVMHFIDSDHMWLEIDRNDPITDRDFPGADFRGREIVFWRRIVG